MLDTFTVDWTNPDACVYTTFDPDPTTQTFAYSQTIDTASVSYYVPVPNSEAVTQANPIACGERTTTITPSYSYINIAET